MAQVESVVELRQSLLPGERLLLVHMPTFRGKVAVQTAAKLNRTDP
jgi:hypothetical protein